MKVSLIITTYNRYDALIAVLESVEKQSQKPHEVIIADDGSSQTHLKPLTNFIRQSRLNIIHSWHKDKGFRAARARNKAIALSSGEYIILIDGDMILNKFFIQDHIDNSMTSHYIQGSRVLMSEKLTNKYLVKSFNLCFFSKGILSRENAIRSKILSKIFSRKSENLKSTKTCNMSFFKKDFIAVNGFNNSIEGWGREDTEFIARLFNSGISKISLKFLAIQYHLWHKQSSRKSLKRNDLILKNTITQKMKTCDSGVGDYF